MSGMKIKNDLDEADKNLVLGSLILAQTLLLDDKLVSQIPAYRNLTLEYREALVLRLHDIETRLKNQ